jgi:hypothetical protein
MNIKTKKKNKDGFVRLETSGDIKEVLFKEDFLKPKQAGIAICFKGKDSSGIVELSPKEMEAIIHDFTGKMDLLKSAKVMKFEKE